MGRNLTKNFGCEAKAARSGDMLYIHCTGEDLKYRAFQMFSYIGNTFPDYNKDLLAQSFFDATDIKCSIPLKGALVIQQDHTIKEDLKLIYNTAEELKDQKGVEYDKLEWTLI